MVVLASQVVGAAQIDFGLVYSPSTGLELQDE